MPYGIANVNHVFASGKAIRSESRHGVVWFYRDDRTYFAHRDGEQYEIDRDTIERNVDHEQTDVETVPVEESPFN